MNKFEAANILGLVGTVSQEDIKKAYRKKAAEFHPDRNPNGTEMMQIINAAYDLLKDVESLEVFEDKVTADYPNELSKALNAITQLHGIDIVICGLWVWVSGNTKEHKETLKENGFKWSKNKAQWYYRPAKAKSYRKSKEWNMDDIKNHYGSTVVKTNHYEQITEK